MTPHPGFDQSALRAAFACVPSGVTAVCGTRDGRPEGMVASSFTSVSIDPPLVSLCVARSSTTWPKLAPLELVGLSVLAAEHGTVARSLASKCGDRFSGVEWTANPGGAVFVHGSTLWLECSMFDQVPAGDHDIVILRIVSMVTYPDVSPMIFHGSAFRVLAPIT
jgi:flavin reductase (DIM6/NTAB) family NADH-FMN oxidoreductase RutF